MTPLLPAPRARTGARRRRTGAVTGLAALTVTLLVGSTASPAQAQAQAERLAGASRYQTAVEISEHGFPLDADVVYLARGDGFADALAAGVLQGGPVLLVPSDGSVPAAVVAEVERLGPDLVVALGGESAVRASTLAGVAQGRETRRLAGGSRYETAIAISRFGFPEGAQTVLLARADGYADALAAGALSGGPILLVPSDGSLPAPVAAEVARLDPEEVIALGGASAVPASTLATLSRGRQAQRLAGSTRFETAARIAQHGFPDGSTVVHLARGDGFADALAAGPLDTPTLLVPPTGAVPAAVLTEVRRLGPFKVIALGGESAVSGATLSRVAAEGATPPSEAPGVPDQGADPDQPAPPAPEPGTGGGVVGNDGGTAPPPPPYPSHLPPPVPVLSVAEHHGIDVPPAPTGVEMTGLPGSPSDGTGTAADSMPVLAPQAPTGRARYRVQHAQPNYTVWGWDRIAYNSLPSAVGRMYASDDGVNWRGTCTATVIGRDQILTAAHCFYTSAGRTPTPYFRFYPDLHGSQNRYGSWSGTIDGAMVDRHWTEQKDAFYADYGVLKLSPNVTGQRIGDVVGSFPVHMDADQFTGNRFTIGYPREGMYDPANATISQYADCSDASCFPRYCWSPVGDTFTWEQTGYYRSTGFGCYTNGGWSGGPVFQYSNGRYYLVSVVSTMANMNQYSCPNPTRCVWYANNSWAPVFRYDRFISVWNASQ